MKRLFLSAGAAGVITLLLALPSAAWWPKGHGIIARAALKSLPTDVPAFFRGGEAAVAHYSEDPDVAKNRDAANVNDSEGPEHYIDLELLGGRPLPTTRYAYLKLCAEAKLDPSHVGLVPYSIADWTDRLAVAFAEHRKYPQNPFIQSKILVYAGFLSHYAGDLVMPLHTTVHHDGRAKPDGSTPRSGIHMKVDQLVEKLELDPAKLAQEQKPVAADALFPAIVKEMESSHALVDRVYELESQLPATTGMFSAPPPVREFATERARAGTRFLASLYLTAWQKSAKIKLPAWLERESGNS